ncbi:UNVERIFIED_CONTAM: hypothetical protein K2H54_022822 [Gekko kuhli]
MSQYFSILTIPSQRRAFMLARLNIFPLALWSQANNKGIPYEARLCKCLCKEPDSAQRILLNCPLFTQLRLHLISPLLQLSKATTNRGIEFLLADKTPEVTEQVAEFLANIPRDQETGSWEGGNRTHQID